MDKFSTKLRYQGRLHRPDDALVLAQEVEDICHTNGWPCRIWDEDWTKPSSVQFQLDDGALETEGHAPLKGITFTLHSLSEIVWLTFTPDGVLHSLMTLNDPFWTSNVGGYPWSRVKTGFDGAVTHGAICRLFWYLKDKYFEVFDCQDELGYWQNRDQDQFETMMEHLITDYTVMEEELNAILSDETIDPPQKRAILHDLLRQFGQKYPRKA